MKKLTILAILILPLFMGKVYAQADNNDTDVATHAFNLTVPELALIDIWDNNQSAEAAVIAFNLGQISVVGSTAEAGLYYLDSISYTDLYLNYTSVVSNPGDGTNTTRQINVQFLTADAWPESLDLRITPEVPSVVAGGGSVDSAGDITAGGVTLNNANATVDQLLVQSIESVYTGDEAQGVRLTYSLEQNGGFEDYKAGIYNQTIQYTISDF